MYTIITQVLYFSRAAEFEPHGHRITSKLPPLTLKSASQLPSTSPQYLTVRFSFLNFLPLSLILLIIQNNNSLLSPKEDYINYHKLSPPPSISSAYASPLLNARSFLRLRVFMSRTIIATRAFKHNTWNCI